LGGVWWGVGWGLVGFLGGWRVVGLTGCWSRVEGRETRVIARRRRGGEACLAPASDEATLQPFRDLPAHVRVHHQGPMMHDTPPGSAVGLQGCFAGTVLPHGPGSQ
jgi:hypothetical protein